jgi:hypothetical protein
MSFARDEHEKHLARRQRLWRGPVTRPAPALEEVPASPVAAPPVAPVPIQSARPTKPKAEAPILPASLSVRDVAMTVAEFYKVSIEDMISPRRKRATTHARHVAIYVARVRTIRSLSRIGRAFGGRDHGTIMHAIYKIEALVRENRAIVYDLAIINRRLDDVLARRGDASRSARDVILDWICAADGPDMIGRTGIERAQSLVNRLEAHGFDMSRTTSARDPSLCTCCGRREPIDQCTKGGCPMGGDL